MFWDVRIGRLSKLVVDEPLFEVFNATLNDYNGRCSTSTYYDEDMAAVERELAARSGQIRASADKIYNQWAREHLAPVVRSIQRDLTKLGYQPGPVDGIIGPQTRAAIRKVEADYGVNQTGQASFALRDALERLAGDT